VPRDFVLIIVTAIAGGLLLLGAGLALVRERRVAPEPGDRANPSPVGGKYEVDTEIAEAGLLGLGTGARNVIRILWWVTLAAVLLGVGLSGSYGENQTLIFATGAIAVVVVVVLHELLPPGWRSSLTNWFEVLIAFALAGGLLLFTGYGASPYVFTLDLIVVAVALAGGGWSAAGAALLGSGVYLGIIALDPNPQRFASGNLLALALAIASLWLLTFVAAVFAANERRIRTVLSRLSRIDPLTGLFNRAQLYLTLDQEVRRTRRNERSFSLLMMDLDGLKAVNDGLGHQRGDDVLRSMGRVIRDDIRTVDSAYRYGGDEFLVLLPETDYAGAFVVAEKIRSDAEELGLRLEGEGVTTSVSIGLVSHPEDGATVEELVRAADKAMYNAKALGKNQISGFPRPFRVPPQLGFGALDQPPGPAERTIRPETPHQMLPAGGVPMPEPQAHAAGGAGEEAAGSEGPEPVLIAERWVAVPEPEAAIAAVPIEAGEEEPDAVEFRRRIAVATRSFDPDHQIRAAMDAFLSPPTRHTPRRPD